MRDPNDRRLLSGTRAPEGQSVLDPAKDECASASPAGDLSRPSAEEAERAVETLIRWAGDDPRREGLQRTPRRVTEAFREFFSGYDIDPRALLGSTFEEVSGYDEMVVLRDLRIESHCEHHLTAIIGNAHVAYLPDRRVVGISELARIVDAYARRLQIQERLTAEIARTIQEVLEPKGVGVVLEATHDCMACRGVRKPGSSLVTSQMLGAFRRNPTTRREFLSLISASRGPLGR